MKIQDLLNKKVMLLDLQATTKEAAIDEMINSLVDNGVVTDFDVFKAGIMERQIYRSAIAVTGAVLSAFNVCGR